MKTAVLYLRVSTTSQVQTDHDPEGISIPAQRAACERKAAQMGIAVIGEYVEPGRSATTIENRPAFQRMFERIKADRDVDYVIVYNLSRLNRNRVDDLKVLTLMRAMKVTLISAQENIDETPAGQLMHGILAAFNEYRSNADGADIRYKMGQKAKNGGTLGRARLGYLNVRVQVDGHEVRTVAIDEERAPLVRLAFELFATGDYTIVRLAEALTSRGLTTRGRGRRDGGALSLTQLTKLLRDRYYLGLITYEGEEYPGRHPALVTPDLFERVQGVLDGSQPRLGERQRKHHHYLKGLMWCGRCHDHGVESRLVLARAIGKSGGTYWYFFCVARQTHRCDAPYIRVEDAEAAVVDHHATIRIPTEVAARIHRVLDETLADEERSARLLHGQLAQTLAALERKEENLLDLVAEGELVASKIRTRLSAIAAERGRLQGQLDETAPKLAVGAANLRAAVDLLDEPQELYRQASNGVRRQLNAVFFGRLYADDGGITADTLTPSFDGLVHLGRRQRPSVTRASRPPARESGARRDAARPSTLAALLDRAVFGGGSSKAAMVELRGFEPLTPSMRTRCATGLRHSPETTGIGPDGPTIRVAAAQLARRCAAAAPSSSL
jgi:site-specific DNA recombinase